VTGGDDETRMLSINAVTLATPAWPGPSASTVPSDSRARTGRAGRIHVVCGGPWTPEPDGGAAGATRVVVGPGDRRKRRGVPVRNLIVALVGRKRSLEGALSVSGGLPAGRPVAG
jgi:hypothetical protein